MTTSISHLFQLSSGHCYYCGCVTIPSRRTVDHLTPRTRHGRTIPSNVVPACQSCNSSKQNKTFHEYRAWALAHWLHANPSESAENFTFWGEKHLPELPLDFNPPKEDLHFESSLADVNLALYGENLAGFTGHRPERIPGYADPYNQAILRYLIQSLTFGKYQANISGFALGFDTLVARESIDKGIPLIAAIPFPQQAAYWKLPEIQEWAELRTKAQVVKFVFQQKSPEAYQQRNEWIVDHCRTLIALWDGERKGGTWNCIQYARRKKKPVINLWPIYLKYRNL